MSTTTASSTLLIRGTNVGRFVLQPAVIVPAQHSTVAHMEAEVAGAA
ncbi:hypothetical protein [Acidovorax sp. SUPP3334]|nr:hypothetical protein [Acidovorax sp. SUPP3334]GKT26918.1 hypothetical protein AVHM3334_22395 [Acidovorax sp. SUPP3334]